MSTELSIKAKQGLRRPCGAREEGELCGKSFYVQAGEVAV